MLEFGAFTSMDVKIPFTRFSLTPVDGYMFKVHLFLGGASFCFNTTNAVSDYSFFRTDWISLFARFGYVFHKESASVLFDDTQPNWGGFSSSSDRYGVLHASCRSRILPPGMHHRRLPDRKKSESALQPYCWIRTWRRKGIIKGSTIGF